jgi:hypothetical protein
LLLGCHGQRPHGEYVDKMLASFLLRKAQPYNALITPPQPKSGKHFLSFFLVIAHGQTQPLISLQLSVVYMYICCTLSNVLCALSTFCSIYMLMLYIAVRNLQASLTHRANACSCYKPEKILLRYFVATNCRAVSTEILSKK